MKKKLVIGITIIGCLLFSLFIMGIFLVNQDEKSLKQLKNEIENNIKQMVCNSLEVINSDLIAS